MRFMIGVVAPALVAGKVVVEEVCGNINADHVADVKVAHHGQGKENDETADSVMSGSHIIASIHIELCWWITAYVVRE